VTSSSLAAFYDKFLDELFDLLRKFGAFPPHWVPFAVTKPNIGNANRNSDGTLLCHEKLCNAQ
jgi:hypothetical protein